MGADIEGAGTSTIRVRGKKELHGATHTIIPDRIEAGTFLVAGAITNGHLKLTGCAPEHLASIIAKLRETGVEIRETAPGTLEVRGAKKLIAADVTTEEYPGFATDMQAQFMALATQAEGTSGDHRNNFRESFSSRQRNDSHGRQYFHRRPPRRGSRPYKAFRQRSDRLGPARQRLAGAGRASRRAAKPIIDRVYHIDRGYERIEEKLAAVGARIRRV